MRANNVQTFREGLMLSKAELARKAGLSTLTIDRVEAGRPCRLDTKRKILLALGLRVTDKDRVFGPDQPSEIAPAQGIPARVAGSEVTAVGERSAESHDLHAPSRDIATSPVAKREPSQ